ncbi:MAG: hypothetical protein HW380_916 [Magnetococcales bacterium]|nr:hypothetical protein [Magnetococcales bacterium]
MLNSRVKRRVVWISLGTQDNPGSAAVDKVCYNLDATPVTVLFFFSVLNLANDVAKNRVSWGGLLGIDFFL